jgi:hypothetical protein
MVHLGAGRLSGERFCAHCTVEDISVTGARARVDGEQPCEPAAVPHELALTTTLAGQEVTVVGEVVRVEPASAVLRVAMHFFNGDSAGLEHLPRGLLAEPRAGTGTATGVIRGAED